MGVNHVVRVARHPSCGFPVRVLRIENSTRGANGARNSARNGPDGGHPGGSYRLGYYCLGLSPRVKEPTAKESGPEWERSESGGHNVASDPLAPVAGRVTGGFGPPTGTNVVPPRMMASRTT